MADTADSPRSLSGSPDAMTGVKWLICAIAAIGFAFDIYEILMAPLVIPPALQEIGKLRPGTPEFRNWASAMFYVPALCGGVFGLLGGYLTDRLGRRRVLTWSILLYAVSAFLAGFSTNLWMLLILRSTTFVGVCVEFVAAVAWLAELFVNPKRREQVLGYTQAFSSIGGFLAAVVNDFCVQHGAGLPAVHLPAWLHFGAAAAGGDPHAAWRYTLMSGVIPALPLIVIRPFLPESPVWQQRRSAGTLRRPSLGELFAPKLRRTTLVTTFMFACSYGAAFGAIQQIPQIVGGLPEVQKQIKEAVAALPAVGKPATKPATKTATKPATPPATAPAAAAAVAAAAGGESPATLPSGLTAPGALGAQTSTRPTTDAAVKGLPPANAPDPRAAVATAKVVQGNAAKVAKVQEVGGLIGRFVLAMLATYIVSRRKLIRIFQLPGLIIMPVVFAVCAIKGLSLLQVGIFLAGFVTVAQLSFWGNYLPRVYPVHLRGTGESFAANIGGRLLGTLFFGLTQTLAVAFGPKDPTPVQAAHALAYTAAGVGLATYVLGFIASFFLPEPPPEDAEEHAA